MPVIELVRDSVWISLHHQSVKIKYFFLQAKVIQWDLNINKPSHFKIADQSP